MNWESILKDDDKKERWKRYQESVRRGFEQKKPTRQRKPDQPRFTCAMCGKQLSRYDKKEHKRGQLNFCKECKESREK